MNHLLKLSTGLLFAVSLWGQGATITFDNVTCPGENCPFSFTTVATAAPAPTGLLEPGECGPVVLLIYSERFKGYWYWRIYRMESVVEAESIGRWMRRTPERFSHVSTFEATARCPEGRK